MKISKRVSELLGGHEIMTDGRTDGQGDYYSAQADFVLRGHNKDKS